MRIHENMIYSSGNHCVEQLRDDNKFLRKIRMHEADL